MTLHIRAVDYVGPGDAALVDRIEAIRAQNNTHWMDLVRLALQKAPDETREILRAIAEGDGEVRRLTKELAR